MENIVVLNDASGEPNYQEVHLLHPASGIYGAILPMLDRAPGLRDLASGYRSLELNSHVIDSGMSLELRRCLFDGWCSTAPPSWSSSQSLDSHKGGVPIWEYEQAMLDVVEAVSHQSGRPEPAVTIIEKVPLLQKLSLIHI